MRVTRPTRGSSLGQARRRCHHRCVSPWTSGVSTCRPVSVRRTNSSRLLDSGVAEPCGKKHRAFPCSLSEGDLKRLLDSGVAEPCDGAHISLPVFTIPKRDRSSRLLVDGRPAVRRRSQDLLAQRRRRRPRARASRRRCRVPRRRARKPAALALLFPPIKRATAARPGNEDHDTEVRRSDQGSQGGVLRQAMSMFSTGDEPAVSGAPSRPDDIRGPSAGPCHGESSELETVRVQQLRLKSPKSGRMVCTIWTRSTRGNTSRDQGFPRVRERKPGQPAQQQTHQGVVPGSVPVSPWVATVHDNAKKEKADGNACESKTQRALR